MPWKDKSKRTTYQKKYYARKKQDSEWFKKKSEQRAITNNRMRSTAYRLIENARKNARNDRIREIEIRGNKKLVPALSREGVRVLNEYQMRNPLFKIEDRFGNVTTETLHDPLPVWKIEN